MVKVLWIILVLNLVSCVSSVVNQRSNSVLSNCSANLKAWDVFPGHFFDQEIHLVPLAPRYNPNSTHIEYVGESGYQVVFLKKGSYYETIGIENGDVITNIDGTDLKIKDPTLLSANDQKNFQKIKEGKKFSINRCLKRN